MTLLDGFYWHRYPVPGLMFIDTITCKVPRLHVTSDSTNMTLEHNRCRGLLFSDFSNHAHFVCGLRAATPAYRHESDLPIMWIQSIKCFMMEEEDGWTEDC